MQNKNGTKFVGNPLMTEKYFRGNVANTLHNREYLQNIEYFKWPEEELMVIWLSMKYISEIDLSLCCCLRDYEKLDE